MEKINEFRDFVKKYPKLCKITELTHPKTKKIIQSFYTQEYAFKKGNILPCFARGFFILPNNTIIARGYDKFFNIGEIRQTKWENIETQTIGPYELTLKENGCIIFVSVYENDLFVSSKHSITKINRMRELEVNNHADRGEKWLYKYIGDKKEELIEFIKQNNITLVFELIDNSFEEHVLEYSKEENGLYLHGINENLVEFKTWPSEKVDEVAKMFNLIHVECKIYDNINELRKYVDSCNGYYNGKAIEGWVIRCKKTNGDTFFFKYKYDEPYLLYREWREATNAFISHKKMSYKYTQTYNYMEWVKDKYQTNRELFSEFLNKKGIIKIRNMYLEETKDKKYIPKFQGPVTKENALFKLILPVGITAMGKSTVGRMLKILYNIAHIETDSYYAENGTAETKFINYIYNAFETNTIIMIDKNNHIRKERNKLCEKLKIYYPNTLWIEAINWDIKSVPEREILKFTRDRIDKRGENHEFISPEKSRNYPLIVKSFFNKFEEIDLTKQEDKYINEVIQVQFKESSVNIVKKLIRALNLEPKTDEELEEAFQEARRVEIKPTENSKIFEPIYYGLRIKYLDCTNLALKCLKEYSNQNVQFEDEYKEVKKIIKKSNFLQREHVVLATRKNEDKEIIKYYNELIGSSNEVKNFNNPDFEVVIHVSSIVWTPTLVFIPVDSIESNKLKTKDNDSDLNYTITLACTNSGNTNTANNMLKNIKTYYKAHSDLKPSSIMNTNITLIDEPYVIDDTNKDKENDIIHPDSIYKLLPTSLKNTTFIKPVKFIKGPEWKQLFFEPFKFKGYYTGFYY